MHGSLFLKTWVSFTQGCYVPSLLDFGPGLLENFLKRFCQHIFAISLLSSLGKRIEQTWIPLNQGCFVQKFSWNWPSCSWKVKMKMWNGYRQTDGQQGIRKVHLSFQPRWAKNQTKLYRKCESHKHYLKHKSNIKKSFTIFKLTPPCRFRQNINSKLKCKF